MFYPKTVINIKSYYYKMFDEDGNTIEQERYVNQNRMVYIVNRLKENGFVQE